MKQKRDGSAATPDPGAYRKLYMRGGGILEVTCNSQKLKLSPHPHKLRYIFFHMLGGWGVLPLRGLMRAIYPLQPPSLRRFP